MGKKLLNEATVRKFMKLANIDRLTNNFVNETYSMEEEELEEGHDCGDHDGMTHEEWVKESDEKTIREAIRRAFAKAIKERTNKRD